MSVNVKDYSPFAPHSDEGSSEWKPEKEKFQEEELDPRDMRRRTSIAEGQMKHNKLGWKRLTVSRSGLPSTWFGRTLDCPS